ncbi:MAG: ribosome hibernation-promoting factor, HPF/YfiA family [Gammaproteobacteria bacterium]
MNITVSGHGLEITDALKNTAEEKLHKLERHLHKITQIHIVLHVEKNRHMAEATVNHKGGQLRASAESEDMYNTINLLADKLDRQAIKFKEKTHDHGRADNEGEE